MWSVRLRIYSNVVSSFEISRISGKSWHFRQRHLLAVEDNSARVRWKWILGTVESFQVPSVRDKNNFKIVKVFCKIIWMSRGSRNPLPAPSLKIIAAVKRDCAKQTCQCDEGGGVESQTPGFHGGKGNAPPKRFNWTGWKLKKNSTVEWNGFWARKLIRHVRGRSQVCQTLIGFKWMAFSAAGAAGAALSRR